MTHDSHGESNGDRFEEVRHGTRAVYERNAAAWDRQRPPMSAEAPWLARLTEGLGPRASVLDLGCGSGGPIATGLLAAGLRYVGIDYSTEMLLLARARHAEAHWLCADMRALPTIGPFHVIVSWDGFFHLSAPEQRSLLAELPRLLTEDGRLLLTIGDRAGEVMGVVNGERVYHASLDPAEYEQILSRLGVATIEIVLEDARWDGRSILFGRR